MEVDQQIQIEQCIAQNRQNQSVEHSPDHNENKAMLPHGCRKQDFDKRKRNVCFQIVFDHLQMDQINHLSSDNTVDRLLLDKSFVL